MFKCEIGLNHSVLNRVLDSALARQANAVLVSFVFVSLSACSSQELKAFGADVVHNTGCNQQYEHMHKGDTLRDECLYNRR